MTTITERAILCSILEDQYLLNVDEIRNFDIDPVVFTTKCRRKIAHGIISLRKNDEPLDAGYLRGKAIKAHKWDMDDDHELLAILSAHPFGSVAALNRYYLILNKYYNDTRVSRI